jgi:diaminopimelate epimerase
MRFEKWQALGNDYIVLERDALLFELTEERIRRICEAHFGVGSDGVLLLSRPDRDEAVASSELDHGVAGSSEPDRGDLVARLEIYNPDGSRAELSGNGAREAILYLRHHGWTDAERFSILTDAGVISPHITAPESCRVDMGNAGLTSKDYPDGPADGTGEIQVGDHSWRFRHVSIGNPQCAIAVTDVGELESLDLQAIGPLIEGDRVFPNRTNVSWYTEVSPASEERLSAGSGGDRPARIRARIFERGVGETLSSGTGACGAAIAYVLGGGTSPMQDLPAGRRRQVEVLLDGGELLVEVGEGLQVHLTGWARPVFSGNLSDQFIKELHETE